MLSGVLEVIESVSSAIMSIRFQLSQYSEQEAQEYLHLTQEHITQTADNTIFYFAKGFEGLYLECYRNPTKLLLTLKITLKIVQQETHVVP